MVKKVAEFEKVVEHFLSHVEVTRFRTTLWEHYFDLYCTCHASKFTFKLVNW